MTPLRRASGRSVTTVDGLGDAAGEWASSLCATGGSQCGFCTPGIVVRLEALRRRGDAAALADRGALDRALAAHLCRCTGWATIREAAVQVSTTSAAAAGERDLDAAARRATIEGGSPQQVSPLVALGRAGFADDTAPADALVAVSDGAGGWCVAETMAQARGAAATVQGRRTTVEATPPIDLPPGRWTRTLQTSWVEPAYLETDAAWCEPGGVPSSPLANGGAFGAKSGSDAGVVARRLADEHGRPVRVRWTREDTVRRGPKRPPVAAGVDDDGRAVIRLARTPGIADAVRAGWRQPHLAGAPGLVVEEVDVVGPPTSAALRGAGWVEAAVLASSLSEGVDHVVSPAGARATASVAADGSLDVTVRCGRPLDAVVLRSYCLGAAHMALGWVTSEAIAVDDDGRPQDLTIRSFGIVRPGEMPEVRVVIEDDDGPPCNGSDAVYAAVAAAVWRGSGWAPVWPTVRR